VAAETTQNRRDKGRAPSDLTSNRREFLVTAAAGLATVVGSSDLATAAQITGAPISAGLDDFVALSEDLTGVSSLDRALALHYLRRYVLTFSDQQVANLDRLVQAHKQIRAEKRDLEKGLEEVFKDDELWETAEQIIYVWYLSGFFMKEPEEPAPKNVSHIVAAQTAPAKPTGPWAYGSLEEYEKALAWTVLGAHTPMTRGGPIGYWLEPPAGI